MAVMITGKFLFISCERLITLTEQHKEGNLAYLSTELDLINVFWSSAVIETWLCGICFFINLSGLRPMSSTPELIM